MATRGCSAPRRRGGAETRGRAREWIRGVDRQPRHKTKRAAARTGQLERPRISKTTGGPVGPLSGPGGSAKGEHMTETASGAASQGSSKRADGLTLRRIYTREGVHPYDEVTWERRDVVMTNWRDGSVNFEQRGVEFPDFWSVNAANIVTTKYFRGAPGTPQR